MSRRYSWDWAWSPRITSLLEGKQGYTGKIFAGHKTLIHSMRKDNLFTDSIKGIAFISSNQGNPWERVEGILPPTEYHSLADLLRKMKWNTKN